MNIFKKYVIISLISLIINTRQRFNIMSKREDLKKAKEAVKVAKKTEKTAKKGKKLANRSSFQKVIPYVSILLSIILGLCFLFVNIMGSQQRALLILQQFICGLFGGAAYFLPAILLTVGIVWISFHLKFKPSDARDGSDRIPAFISANQKALRTTILLFIEFFMLSTILGIIANIATDNTDYNLVELWDHAADEMAFVSGGVVGGSFAFLFGLFHNVISLVVLIIIFVFILMMILGFTPQYIYNKVQYHRELSAQTEEYNEEEDEKRMQALREKEMVRAKKRHEREHIAEQKREARAYAEAQEFGNAELQPPSEEFSRPKSKKAPEPEPEDEDDDILLDGIGITDADMDVTLQPPQYPRYENAGIDFGGDDVIDGMPSVDELLSGIGEAPDAEDETIQMSQISDDELGADLQSIIPEVAEETVQEEIALPYVFPPIDKLSINKNAADPNVQAELQENAKVLKDTLKSFNVQIRDINYSRGPTVTRYELKPEVGTKVKSIANLVDDIALNLATSGVRIEAPIPNKPAVGIEVPNRHPEIVYLRDLIESPKFTESKSRVTACLGKDIGGNAICFDIAKMPHLLIAGATGMGKSVCINCIIISLLYKARPEEVKLILIDPKKVEFAMYKDIPHLYAPIVSDPKKATGALASAVVEMERRFELIENAGVRNIDGYNQSIADDPTQEKLPQIVIIIDELADLMMTAGKDVESCICRLAQKARAAGIHIIIGTQRPSVDGITGLIKANIPSRIACTVASQIDSRTILDMAGAEKLIGRGDMLFAPVGASKPMRVQGAFVSDSEVEDIVNFVKSHNSSAKYNADFISTMETTAKNLNAKKNDMGSSEEFDEGASSGGGDTKFEEAVKLAIDSGKISTSLLQRRLGVGYGRAAKLIDLMEEKGYVSAANGTKPREVLITMNEFLERKSSGDVE